MKATALLLFLHTATALFSGDLTYYGGAGKAGTCSSGYVPKGNFTTVAMNKLQFKTGASCGDCLHACFTEKGDRKCFDAIVDNECPECHFGSLDLGQKGEGRWPVSWAFIECPKAPLKVEIQGSNAYYAKIKILQGPSAVHSLVCDDIAFNRTSDGFWTHSDPKGEYGCGLECVVTYAFGAKVTKVKVEIDGKLLVSGRDSITEL